MRTAIPKSIVREIRPWSETSTTVRILLLRIYTLGVDITF